MPLKNIFFTNNNFIQLTVKLSYRKAYSFLDFNYQHNLEQTFVNFNIGSVVLKLNI